MRHEKSELLQGTLDLLILHIVALGPANGVHGYAVARRLQQMSNDTLQVQQGSLYPALHRLEERGWLRAEWRATETGREAKFYGLTKAGRKHLAAERSSWDRFAAAISLVLRTVE
jgi:PadR family transcriptional regulator, regulatory protein PadR